MKILFLAPHLSTGGMPAFLLKRLESLINYSNVEIMVVEYEDITGGLFVVQKEKIKNLIGGIKTLGSDKMELIDIIKKHNIDIVHLDEMIECFGDFDTIEKLASKLYANDRTWRIVETCHGIAFNPDTQKRYHPDMYAFCTPYHKKTFANMPSSKSVIEFPIDNKKVSNYQKSYAMDYLQFDASKINIVNIGLWTRGKNQAEGIEIARKYPNINFHFVGNQAGNFQDYWQPLMGNLPNNVKVWGERDDTDIFLRAADGFMFNSTWECNPLVLREAISHGLPIISRNLPQYLNMFTGYLMPILTDLSKVDFHRKPYDIPTNNTSKEFAKNHMEVYMHVANNDIQAQNINIIQHFVNSPFLEIRGISGVKKVINKDSVSIVMAHANNDNRKNLLKKCLSQLSTTIILSTNYPVDDETQSMCDYVIYTKENPLLYKDEFEKNGVGYYKWSMINGEKVYEPFEFEHGYAAYTLTRNGLELAKKIGAKKVNVINYDYQIYQETIAENTKLLDEYEMVLYTYDSTSYDEKSYCSAFFSANIDKALGFFTKFNTKESYYRTGEPFNILEIKLYNYIKEKGYKVKEISYSKLEDSNVVDSDSAIVDVNKKERKEFFIKFFDGNNLFHETSIDVNHWVRLKREYYTKWNTKIWQNGKLILDNTLDYTNSRVLISIDSKSLGDTIAWMPYALEFKKKHNCHVIVSTFWNHMFDYPELEFISPGQSVDNILGQYNIGWFYDANKEPELPHEIPMQKAATNILGLEYKEIKPKLKLSGNVEKVKQVCIAIHSTTQAKYLNNPDAWQGVVDYLLGKGYVVKLISKEGEEYMGNFAPKGIVLHPAGPIESVIEELRKSEMFIGIGSGLSWLSWALDVPTVLISGFSEPFTEMEDCTRITAPIGKCSGCFNRHRLDAGDWNWCPDHKGTERQFECTKSITAEMIINKIQL